MPITWLLFDIGGVLEVVDDQTWPATYVRRFADRLGISADEFEARLATVTLPDAGTQPVREEFWRVYGSAVGADPELMRQMQAEFWDAYCGVANTELIDFARSLIGRVGLAILSNSGDGAREEEERRFGFSMIFDPICYSHELGVTKPDPKAYDLAVRGMRTQPESVLFIDNAIANVEAARAVGLHAIQHVDNAATIRAISEQLPDVPVDYR